MKNRFGLRLSTLLCSTFCSCPSSNLADVIENPVFASEPKQKSIEPPPPPPPSPPKPIPFRSICRPDCKETKRAVQNSFITCKEANILRQNRASVSRDRETTPLSFESAGRSNQSRRSKTSRRRRKAVYSKSKEKPEAYFTLDNAPSSVLYNKGASQNSFLTCKEANILRQNRASVSEDPESTTPLNFDSAGRSNQSRRSKTSRGRRKAIDFKSSKKSEVYFALDNAPSSVLYNNGWETEDDEEEEDGTETLFSSRSATRSVSSDSSVEISLRREGPIVVDPGPGPLRGSMAVVKCSADRYSDFRNSMVEMIVERQIFAVEDLEQLLLCFLSLNASQHHSTIVEVFVGICEALFSARD